MFRLQAVGDNKSPSLEDSDDGLRHKNSISRSCPGAPEQPGQDASRSRWSGTRATGGTGGYRGCHRRTSHRPSFQRRRRKPARRTRRSSINKSVSQRWPTRTDVEDVDARLPLVDDKNCDCVVLTELDPLVRRSSHGEDHLDLGVCAPQCSGKSVWGGNRGTAQQPHCGARREAADRRMQSDFGKARGEFFILVVEVPKIPQPPILGLHPKLTPSKTHLRLLPNTPHHPHARNIVSIFPSKLNHEAREERRGLAINRKG